VLEIIIHIPKEETMSRLEYYVETNISDYVIDSCGYANIKNKDVEEELHILSQDDESFLDEVMSHHIKSGEEAQILLTKAVYGDWMAGIRFFAMIRNGMVSYLAYELDNMACEGLLEKWQDDYAKEYAEQQRMSEMSHG
jgi:hypothetical protein